MKRAPAGTEAQNPSMRMHIVTHAEHGHAGASPQTEPDAFPQLDDDANTSSTSAGRAQALMSLDRRFDDMKLSLDAFRVYAHLRRRGGKDGKAWPTMRSTGVHCFGHVSRATPDTLQRRARAAVAELEAYGLVTRRAQGDAATGRQRQNAYALTPAEEAVRRYERATAGGVGVQAPRGVGVHTPTPPVPPPLPIKTVNAKTCASQEGAIGVSSYTRGHTTSELVQSPSLASNTRATPPAARPEPTSEPSVSAPFDPYPARPGSLLDQRRRAIAAERQTALDMGEPASEPLREPARAVVRLSEAPERTLGGKCPPEPLGARLALSRRTLATSSPDTAALEPVAPYDPHPARPGSPLDQRRRAIAAERQAARDADAVAERRAA